MQPKVIFEDNHLLVVNKPPGWIVQGAQVDDASLLEWGKSYIKRTCNKPGNVFLAAVSRLDRNVSGIVPLARTSKSAARLNEQIANRTVVKNYIAVVSPVPKVASQELRHHLSRNEKIGKSIAHAQPTPDSAEAILRYRQLDAVQNFALLDIDLQTGRKHQIRCQLEAIGLSIVGDTKYGSREPFKQQIALHCYRFILVHPTTRETLKLGCRPPENWNNFGFDLERFFIADRHD